MAFDRILHPEREPQNWLSYSGNVFNHRHSGLIEITRANAKDLELKWVWQSRSLEKFEATALVVDGVLYTLQGPPVQGAYQVVALDAVTGRPFWTLEYTPSADARPCCGRVSRGLAILGDTLYMGTIDARLIAIDSKTGTMRWNVEAAPLGQKNTEKYTITHAPLVVKDKIILGMGGGDFGVLGFVAAFDSRDGKELWRFSTIPRPGEAGNETWAGDPGRPAAPGCGTAAPTTPRRTSSTSAPAIRHQGGMEEPAAATTSTAIASSRSTRIPAP